MALKLASLWRPLSRSPLEYRCFWQRQRSDHKHAPSSDQDNADQIQEFNSGLLEVFGSPEDRRVAPGSSNEEILTAQAPSRDVLTAPTEVPAGKLTHIDDSGKASMVDVGHKAETSRSATASATVILGSTAFQAVKSNSLAKGDVLSVARLAGIMAAKQTANLIPLCHSLPLEKVSVDFSMRPDQQAIDILGLAQCSGKTGVEMEALTAVAVAALTVYDMCKAVSKDISIKDVQLLSKTGGKSGEWRRQ